MQDIYRGPAFFIQAFYAAIEREFEMCRAIGFQRRNKIVRKRIAFLMATMFLGRACRLPGARSVQISIVELQGGKLGHSLGAEMFDMAVISIYTAFAIATEEFLFLQQRCFQSSFYTGALPKPSL